MNPVPNYPTAASLYVGDLHPDVTEAILFEKFSAVGPIVSIRVCRDITPRRSLGYAYVNFQQPADAERALDTLNFALIKGRPIKVMWSQRDPSLRQSGVGNIFIKNLDKSIDNKAMYDTFSIFGNILSCKVAMGENGENLGYGFVHFETEEAALNAIEKVNGIMLNGQEVYVGKFISRRERGPGYGDQDKFTNVYIKNFGPELADEELLVICETFGKVSSHKVTRDTEGNSTGFGFYVFEDHESAKKCVDELNGKEIKGNVLYAARAQVKSERSAELRAIHQERSNRYQGANLYIKNLDDDIDDERLRKEFSKFGNITSVKVMRDDKGISRGFGFVCFMLQEEAQKALTEMNYRIISIKPLYVSFAQRKEARRVQMTDPYMRVNMNYRMPAGQPMNQAYSGYYPTPVTVPQPQRAPFIRAQMAQINNPPWPMAQTQLGAPAGYQMMPMTGRQFAGPTQIHQARIPMQAAQSQPATISAVSGATQQQMLVTNTGPPAAAHLPRTYTQAARGPQESQQAVQQQQAVHVAGQEPLTAAMLAAAQPQEQKRMLGERLFQIIQESHGNMAGKITSMLLEIDNAELLYMLESRESLQARIDEVIALLKVYQMKEAYKS